MRERVALVCQRYGTETNGGSETHCRHLAERLSAFYDVEVYTTCALDYLSWADHFEPGTHVEDGITVHRFRVKKERDWQVFGPLCGRVLDHPEHTDEEEERWIDEQGPYCPAMLKTLYRKQKEYKVIIFMTYLYYLTARGLPMHFDRALLVPTAHDEPPIYVRYYEKVFQGAKGYIWNTPIEKRFVENLYPSIKGRPGVMAGVGVDLPEGELPESPEEIRNTPYITYVGRIDESKGCGEMFQFFRRYKEQFGGDLKLVLIGKSVMEIPKADDIVELGFVSEPVKYAVMRDAKALVLCSRFESLSAVVLESFTMGRPVLVTGHCDVLKDHCLRSNAGLYFENYEEFAATLNYLLTHPAEYEAMRENGKKYVEENYQWDVIIKRIHGLIEQIGR